MGGAAMNDHGGAGVRIDAVVVTLARLDAANDNSSVRDAGGGQEN